MSAKVVYLFGGEHEHRMRRPHEPPLHKLPVDGATIIILPVRTAACMRRKRQRWARRDNDPRPAA